MSLSLRLFIHTAPPNTALIKVSGKKESEIVIGGRMFAIPFLHRVDTLSLSLRTIIVKTHNGVTVNGVGVSVESACQIKIQGWTCSDEDDTHSSPDRPVSQTEGMKIDYSAVRLAAQHFLGKTDEQIEETIKRTISGHQRAIIGSLTVEELYRDRDTFVARVLQLITSDMRNMGLAVVSYTVSDINDVNGYIDALGVTQTEKVKREASEGAARYRNAAKSRSAQMEAEAHLIVNRERHKKILSDQDRMVAESKAQQAVVRQKAIQDKSFDISGAEQDAILFVKRKEALSAETQAELSVLKEMVERERLRKERQVNVEADSELYRARLAADSKRAVAAAEAECVKILGVAEANALKAKGLAEVDVLKKRIGVWEETSCTGALMEKMVESLPEVARAVSAPLANTKSMVFVNSGSSASSSNAQQEGFDFVGNLNRLAAEVPPTVEALTGVDITDVLSNMKLTAKGNSVTRGAAEGAADVLVRDRMRRPYGGN